MRQPDHEYEERSFGDIQRAIDFENSMNDLESQLYYQHLSPKEVAQQVLKATCQFYDADWCGLIQVDLDLNLWTPFWWFNAGATDKTMLLTEEYESAEFLDRWVQTVRKGIPMVVPDAEATKEAYPAEYNLYQRLGIRSVIAVSLEPRPVALLAVRNPKRYIQQTSMLRILAYVLLASYNEQKMLNRLQMAYIPTSIQSSKDIYVSLFGELSISTSKGVLKEADFSSPRISRLISYLLISRKNAISPQEITQTLWPDDLDNPAKNVKGLIYRLRQKFNLISDEPLILSSASGYQLNPELHIMTDYQRFDELVSSAVRAYEGYGAQRIATYLNNAGYRARSGKCWHPGSLRGMVGNLTYMGVLRCGDARSELMPELQIIPQEEFEAAQRIREDRSAHAAEEAEHHVPLRTRGQALLSNNVYCGHCGARLALTTSRKWRKLSDGTLDDTLRIRYTCYGKLRKQTDCTGQTGYTMHILDEIIDKMVRQIFSRLRGIPKEQLITSRYAKETAERKNHLQALQAERDKAEKDLLALKTEILAVIKGESAFPKDTLAEMIAAQEKKHTELDTLCEEASAELERNAELMANVSQLYEELISYADLYDSASFEAKKMIVSQLIRRVEVYRGYQIHVDFNFDLAQYLENSDELAC